MTRGAVRPSAESLRETALRLIAATGAGSASAARCRDAWERDDWDEWQRVYLDPAHAAVAPFVGLCFPSYRVGRADEAPPPVPSWDGRGAALHRLLAAAAREADDDRADRGLRPRGRISWHETKRRWSQARRDAAWRALHHRRGRARAFFAADDPAPGPARGRFELTRGVYENPRYLERISTFRTAAPQLVIALHTTPAAEDALREEPAVFRMFSRFQLERSFAAQGCGAFPAHRNTVAWVRADTVSMPGAWLVEEVQSLAAQQALHADASFERFESLRGAGPALRAAFRRSVLALLEGWEHSALASTLAVAQGEGVRRVHLRRAAAVRAGAPRIRRSTLEQLYERLPRRFGFERRAPAPGGPPEETWCRYV